jgi:tetratricopeptide (TPR) repeat protein
VADYSIEQPKDAIESGSQRANIVVSSVQQSDVRRIVILGCTVILIAIAITVTIAGRIFSGNTPTGVATKQQVDNQRLASLEKQSNMDATVEQSKSTASAWKAYATETPSQSHKKLALENAGAIDMSIGDFTQAVVEYKAASTIQGLSYTDAYALAQADMRLGQNTNAIYYLQQSLRLMPSNMVDTGSQRALFNQDIASLGGG